MPLLLLLIVYTIGLTAFNAGVLVFLSTTLVRRPMYWWARVGIALLAFIGFCFAQWAFLEHVAEDPHGPWGKIVIIGLLVFHVLSLPVIGWTIAWLNKRKVTGLKAALRLFALVGAATGFALTLATVIYTLFAYNAVLSYQDLTVAP
ncbi:MAG: hypothetical protein QM724_06060 [Flavobacteriales bacterium]